MASTALLIATPSIMPFRKAGPSSMMVWRTLFRYLFKISLDIQASLDIADNFKYRKGV
jgi:hypothetical protein